MPARCMSQGPDSCGDASVLTRGPGSGWAELERKANVLMSGEHTSMTSKLPLAELKKVPSPDPVGSPSFFFRCTCSPFLNSRLFVAGAGGQENQNGCSAPDPRAAPGGGHPPKTNPHHNLSF